MNNFPHAAYDKIVEDTFKAVRELGVKKGGEYAGDDDRLANFRRNGLAQDLPMATIWMVYAAKHWDAISQWIKDDRNGKTRERMEPIGGRVDDLITYLLLLKAILAERAPPGHSEPMFDLGQSTIPLPVFVNRPYAPADAFAAGQKLYDEAIERAINERFAAEGLDDHPVEDVFVTNTPRAGEPAGARTRSVDNIPGVNALGERI